MSFVWFFAASWAAGFAFYSMRKSLSLIENTIVFLLALILSINYSWTLIEEFKVIELTKEPLDYTAYLMYRSVLTPCLFSIWMNVLYWKKELSIAVPATAALAGILFGLNSLAHYYQIYVYTSWSAAYDLLAVCVLTAVIYFVYRLFMKLIQRREARAS